MIIHDKVQLSSNTRTQNWELPKRLHMQPTGLVLPKTTKTRTFDSLLLFINVTPMFASSLLGLWLTYLGTGGKKRPTHLLFKLLKNLQHGRHQWWARVRHASCCSSLWSARSPASTACPGWWWGSTLCFSSGGNVSCPPYQSTQDGWGQRQSSYSTASSHWLIMISLVAARLH